MQRILIPGVMFLFCLALSACAPQLETDPTPAAFAQVTVFATEAENPLVPAPDAIQPVIPAAGEAQASGSILVVYEKSGSLWSWRAGAATQLTSAAQDTFPSISADGALVAFQRGPELWMVDSSGQNLRKIFSQAGLTPWQFAFEPGSHRLYFSTSAPDGAARYDLHMADAGANVIFPLVPPGQAGRFTFAPNGSLLALVQPDRIMTVRPDGSALTVVIQFQPTKAAQGDYLPAVAWLDNAYGFKTVIPAADGRAARLMFVMADGSPAAQLAEFSAVSPAVNDVHIAPDGSRVLYLREQGQELELHVIDASTADRTYFSYARGKFGLLGWTPDSQGFLYWRDDPRSVWLFNADTQSALSDTTYVENLTWVSQDTYLFTNAGELRLGRLGQPSQLLDTGLTGSFAAVRLP